MKSTDVLAAAVLVLITACGDDASTTPDSGAADTSRLDAASDGAEPRDAAGSPDTSMTPDAGRDDAGAPLECAGQCRYVRAGAIGAGTGNDWNDAFTELPAALERGAVYLVADGDYGDHTFADAVNAGAIVTIRKATPTDHGTETGWAAEHGDGQAAFGAITFESDDYVFDGVTGGGAGSWESGFGFRIQSGGHNIHFEGPRANIVIRHVDVENEGRYHANNGNDISVYAIGGASNLTFDHCFFHDVNGVQFLTRDADGVTLEHSKIARNGPDFDMCGETPCHREAWSASTDSHIVIRHNVFEDISNTAFIFLGNGDGVADSWEIYGNVFWYSGLLDDVGVAGLIDVDPRGITVSNWRFTNNVVANVRGLHAGIKAPGATGADLLVYDNVWLGNSVNSIGVDGEHDFNFFFGNLRTEGCPTPCELDTAGAEGEPNGEVGTEDPFVDSSSGDFTLRIATAPGMALPSPYDIDAFGRLRGADGVWDRGAYELSP